MVAAEMTDRSSYGAISQAAAPIEAPAVLEVAITADDNPALFSRADTVRIALGFPAGSRRAAKHVRDQVRASEYDAVENLDSAGRSLDEIEFSATGRLVSAVRLDSPVGVSARVSGSAASASATRILGSVGLAVAGDPQLDANVVEGGWNVQWARTRDGVAVRGDETRVHVRSDGRIGSVSSVEHELAAAPISRVSADAAKQTVTTRCQSWFGSQGSGYRIGAEDLQWVDPNAAFDPAGLTEARSAYRLAWVANVTPTGPAADYLRLITVFVDAGTGAVIGGDIVE
jgi:hypothetical protein